MPQIIIENLFNKTIHGDPNLTILDNIHENNIDWMHTCGKKGNCTSCKMIVIKGANNLSPPTRTEENFKSLGRLKDQERLACQCKLLGDIIIKVPVFFKLPHVLYSS